MDNSLYPNESAIWLEMMTPNGLVQRCDKVQIDNNEIIVITSFHDAADLRAREGET